MSETNIHPEHHGDDSRVTAHPGANVNVNRFTERASLTLSAVALALSGIAIGVLLVMPMLIDAKIQAGGARSSEEAHSANVKAQLTERDLTIVREALQKKGIDLPPKD